MRYFKLINSAASPETLDITTQEVFFHDIDGLGFEEENDFRRIGSIWRLNSSAYRQKAITGKMCFTDNGDTTPYEKYKDFSDFIAETPLYICYFPHGIHGEEYRKSVRVNKLEKSEINKYGVLDSAIEFMPYTPWYVTDIQSTDTIDENNLPGWVWDIGNKWRDSEEDTLSGVGDITYPFNDVETPTVYFEIDGEVQIIEPTSAYTEEHGEGWLRIIGSNNGPHTINLPIPFSISTQRSYYRLELDCSDSNYRTKLKYENREVVKLIDGSESPILYDGQSCDIIASDDTYTFTVTVNPGETVNYFIRIKLVCLGYFLYKFGGEHSTSIEFNCAVPGLTKISIFGPAINPTWAHHVDGSLYASGSFDSNTSISLTEDEKLVIDNTDGSYSMKIITISTGEERNVYSLRDFDKECFFNLQAGSNTISAASANGSPLRIDVEGHIFYATI